LYHGLKVEVLRKGAKEEGSKGSREKEAQGAEAEKVKEVKGADEAYKKEKGLNCLNPLFISGNQIRIVPYSRF
jgi:hypothetical protein